MRRAPSRVQSISNRPGCSPLTGLTAMTNSPLLHRIAAAATVALLSFANPAAHAELVGQIAAPISFTSNGNNQSPTAFSTAQTGDLYIAMTIELEAGALGSNDFLALWLDNVATGDHTTRPNIGLKSNLGSPDARDWMVRGNGTGGSFAPEQASIGSTTTLWAHLYKTGSSNYNGFDLWVNPSASWTDVLATTPEASSTLDSGLSSISGFGFRSANLSGTDRFTVQSLAISNTVPVTAVPEPGTVSLALAGLGLLGAMARRRRAA
jgi:hypothetical protein